MSLDWITEDEGGDQIAAAPGRRRRGPMRRWSFLLLLLALAGLLAVYAQQLRRANAQEAALAEDISAGHRLWQRSVREQDKELFDNLLQKGDPGWYHTQQRLFATERLLERAALGFHYIMSQEPMIQQVDLAPDWQSAVVLTDYAYQVQTPGGLTETVALQQSAFYARQGNSWRYAPLTEEFWGEPQQIIGQRATLVVPARDFSVGVRLHENLETELARLCAGFIDETACPATLHITVLFETDPALLLEQADSLAPLFQGEAYLLPSPSLVGRPLDEAGYATLYQGYTTRILTTIRHNLLPPIPLPEQDIATLCFPPDGHRLELFRYDSQNALWMPEMPGRAFQYLSEAPNGDGIILQEYGFGQEATYLRLVWQRATGEQLLFSGDNRQRLPRPIGWSGPEDDPRLLVYGADFAKADIFYSLLDLNQCHPDGCALHQLAGYTIWSPDGERTIISRPDGLWLGDEAGLPSQPLEPGFSPFWLDNNNYGYARYDYSAGGAPVIEVVTGAAGSDSVNSRLRSSDIVLPAGGLFFIDYVTVNPAARSQLLLSGPLLKTEEEAYLIYALQLDRSDPPRLVGQLPDTLRGQPGALTPTGYPPFSFSPNGRWLVTSRTTQPATAGWILQLFDLRTGLQRSYEVAYPPYPAKYPFVAWSATSNWLIVAEDGYFRQIAPTPDYQRQLPHPNDTCLYAAWIN